MTRRLLTSLVALSLSAHVTLLPAVAAAQGTVEEQRAEAAERFDRGLRLFDEGDTSGALAEFKRTYELVPNPVVLYNIGLVYAAMGRPVEAVDALTNALASGKLSESQTERARTVLADQSQRIGQLDVKVNVEGARIEVDNVEAGRTPLPGPLKVSSGTHIVGAVAEGYAPGRREILVAGGTTVPVEFTLLEMKGRRLANLVVNTNTLGAEVLVDGQVAARTPLETSLTLPPGKHTIVLKRAGYRTVTKTVDLGDGATGEIELDLEENPSALGREGASLVLDVSEPGALVTVDGASRGVYSAPLRLPRGPHIVRVERAGFIPFERQVDLAASENNVVLVALEPTPETRADHESTVRLHNTLGWVGVIAGGAIAAGGVTYLIINSGAVSDASDALDLIRQEKLDDSGRCDLSGGVAPQACNAAVTTAEQDYDAAKTRNIIGYVGIGVGAVALGTGVVLLLTAPDPDKYKRKAAEGPSIGFVPTGLGGAFVGTF